AARGFVNPIGRLVLGARLAAEQLSGGAPLPAQLYMETSGRPFTSVGGYHSLRGFYDARFIGTGKLLGGLEARYPVLGMRTVFELIVGAFVDVGRVFGPSEPFK